MRLSGICVYKHEATAFADPDNESRVQAAFSKLSQGKTVIMIAHRLSTVAGVDQIYVIEDGQITESGKSRELVEKGRRIQPHVAGLSNFCSMEGCKGGTIK